MTDFNSPPPADTIDLAGTTASAQAAQRPLSIAERAINFGPDLSTFIPAPVTQFVGGGPGRVAAPRITPSLPNNVTALRNKWSNPDVQGAIAQLKDIDRKALIKLDADRVAQGQAPLTAQQTINAAQTIRTNMPATPEPAPSPFAIHTNIVRNVGDIVKSIPRLPMALINEVTSLGEMDDTYDSALANLLNSPGVRMIPGAYIAQGLARGGEGIKELAANPVFTALDVLPAASKLAEMSPVVKAAQEAAAAEGRTVRPLSTLATNKLDDAGNIARNRLGQSMDVVRNETQFGRGLDNAFGARQRDVSRIYNQAEQRTVARAQGLVDATDVDVQLAKRSFDLEKQATEYGWDATKRADLKRIAGEGDTSVMSQLGAQELAFVHDTRALNRDFGNFNVDQGTLGKWANPVTGEAEFYRPEEVAKFQRLKASKEHHALMADLRREAMSNPADLARTPLTDERVAELLSNAEKRGNLGKAEVRATKALLEAHGYDANAFMKAWKHDPATATLGTPKSLMSVEELVAATDQWKRVNGEPDLIVRDLSTALATRDVPRIRKALDSLEARTAKASPLSTDPRFADTVRSMQRRYAQDNVLAGNYSPKTAAKAAKKYDDLIGRSAPARFDDIIQKRAVDKTVSEVAIGRNLSPDDVERVTQAVNNADWEALKASGVDGDHLRKLYSSNAKEVRASWQELVKEGVDPVFVHRVSRSRMGSIEHPTIGKVPNTLSQVKARANDMSAGVGDLSVSVSHQGMEILTRRASQEFAATIADKYGVKQADLMEMVRARAEAAHLADPRMSVRGHMQDIIDKSWARFDPDAWGAGNRLDVYRGEVRYIPRGLSENIDKMNVPANGITASLNKVTNTFRLAVVGLSPRTQLYNILGGATMVMGETGPGVFKYWSRARELVKNPQLIEDEVLRATIGSAKRELLPIDRARMSAHVLGGKTLGRMFQDNQAARAAGKVKDMFGYAINKSLDINGMMDDQYRVMAYLHGYDKQLTKGMSREVAERAGMELANKTMMDWTSMTPFERQTMKAIFPFYGFMNHSLRYVLRYPVDHPLRASIMASFARAEVEDAATLPHSFLSSFFFGGTDSEGGRRAANLAPFNPFGDTANLLTFAGFMSATNPAITTVLEQVGLSRGEAELYPTLRYDPESGRLSATRGNPLMTLAENIIPQTAILTSMLGVNGEFRDRMARDPDSASRFLMSAAGLPLLWRTWSVPGEQAKAEVARMKSETNAKSTALKTGDWTEALRYPTLKDDFGRLLDASPEELAKYRPQGADIYTAMIEQAYGRQAKTASENSAGGSGGAAP